MHEIKKVLLGSVLFFSFMFPGLYAGEVSEDPRTISTDELLLILADDVCSIDTSLSFIKKNCGDNKKMKKACESAIKHLDDLNDALVIILDRLSEDSTKVDQQGSCPCSG